MAPSMPTLPFLEPKRVRSYLMRLPLGTRLLLVALCAFFIASLARKSFQQWAALQPLAFDLTTMHKLNTYPLLHLGIFHFLINLVSITPLLERFEAENGTLITLLIFTGPFSTLPGLSYVFIERFVYHSNTAVQGASVWTFLLLASEAIKAYKLNPNFQIGPYAIPTWVSPLIANLFVAALIPKTSFTGHLCGIAIGYLWGLGYVRFLVPSEKILRWIEGKLNLLGRLPHYVSVDQKTYGRYGLLPSTNVQSPTSVQLPRVASMEDTNATSMSYAASSQRLEQ